MNFKIKSYDTKILSVFDRIKRGKLFDRSLKPYNKELFFEVLKYFEDRELFEECVFVQKVIKERFDHEFNWEKNKTESKSTNLFTNH